MNGNQIGRNWNRMHHWVVSSCLFYGVLVQVRKTVYVCQSVSLPSVSGTPLPQSCWTWNETQQRKEIQNGRNQVNGVFEEEERES